VCGGCQQSYPRLGDIPILLPDPSAYLAACRAQLNELEHNADRTLKAIHEELDAPFLLPTTRARCSAMIDALRAQLADVRAVLDPLLPASARGAASPTRVPSTIEYLHYLYRDWGWAPEAGDENARALAMVEAVIGERPLARTLVLGAGGCRLAYDLHQRDADAETLVVDIDPLLFATAHEVIRGGSVKIREANLEVGELSQSSRTWTLGAPHGPLDHDRFHFVIADGVEPPLAAGAFDTVLTPWFVDEAPDDLRDFIGTVHRLLAPGGRWLNLGPLLYDADVPIALRCGREELFELAARAGFAIDEWRTDSVPYLVSKLNARGKVEWVLAFSATKLEAPAPRTVNDGTPPSWLLFSHLPIPTFAGQTFAIGPRGSELVLSALDGRRSIDDIARSIARTARDPNLSLAHIRAAVRECLTEVHPECKRGIR
jgi:SAM-dependent methyltransferase